MVHVCCPSTEKVEVKSHQEFEATQGFQVRDCLSKTKKTITEVPRIAGFLGIDNGVVAYKG